MMKITKLSLVLLFAVSLATFTGCKDDEEPAAIEILSISATGTDITTGNQITVDLNGATSATDVPPDATITAVFTREIDATTASSANISLNDGFADVVIAVSGKSVV